MKIRADTVGVIHIVVIDVTVHIDAVSVVVVEIVRRQRPPHQNRTTRRATAGFNSTILGYLYNLILLVNPFYIPHEKVSVGILASQEYGIMVLPLLIPKCMGHLLYHPLHLSLFQALVKRTGGHRGSYSHSCH